MSELRPFALVRTGDQWARCSFDRTDLDVEAGVVALAWTTATADSTMPSPTIGAGLAFDNECRLYHSVVASASPGDDCVDRILWKATDPLGPVASQPPPTKLFQGQVDEAIGDFTIGDAGRLLVEPRGLAVDVNDRLFVAETGADRILVYDLWSNRLLQRITLPGARPTDLASRGTDVYAVLAGAHQLIRLTARTGPAPVTLPPGCTAPSRVALSLAGRLAILDNAGTIDARVMFVDAGSPDLSTGWATDIEWESESVLVVALRPGGDFLRYQVSAGQSPVQLPSLRAREYDGLGIVATPDTTVTPSTSGDSIVSRRIGYWTSHGFRNAVPARLIFERVGRVTTFRLDSGEYQTVWGRVFIDACIPDGADLRVHYIVLDEPDDETPMQRVPPANIGGVHFEHPELSPPLPPIEAVPDPDAVVQALHLRESGRELPWTQPAAADRFRTYEAPINAPAGRYLWITLELRGNTRVSPKVQCIRAEYPSHDYLRRLPRTFSRDPQVASFLLRYLAMFEGFLGEIEARSVDRDLLLDPCSTPDECLPWLASFVGLTLDERWATSPAACRTPVDARRRIIKEAVWLFRYRGTLPGLKRFLELYVGVPVIVIEHYRMRGIGAVRLGDDPSVISNSIVGMGFRIGGAVGSETPTAAVGTVEDAYRTHAHRFTVLVPAPLTEEQLEVVTNIIHLHRPAHTIFDVCTAGAGMRVGRGLMLEVSSIIGPTGAFATFQIGDSALGRGAIVGRPADGAAVGSNRIGADMKVG